MEKFTFLVKKNLEKTVIIEAESKEQAKELLEQKIKNNSLKFELKNFEVSEPLNEKEQKLIEFKKYLECKINKYCDLGTKIEAIINNIGYYMADVKLPIVNKTIDNCGNNDVLLLNKFFKGIEKEKWNEAKQLLMTRKTFDNVIFCFMNFKFSECYEDLRTRIYELKLIDDAEVYAKAVNTFKTIIDKVNIDNFEIVSNEFNKELSDMDEHFNFNSDFINNAFESIDDVCVEESEESDNDENECSTCRNADECPFCTTKY